MCIFILLGARQESRISDIFFILYNFILDSWEVQSTSKHQNDSGSISIAKLLLFSLLKDMI